MGLPCQPGSPTVTEVSGKGGFLLRLAPPLGYSRPDAIRLGEGGAWNGNVIFLAAVLLSGRDDLWLYASAGVAAGVYLFYRGFRALQRRRLILDTPPSKIRSASIGLVEVSGLAVGPYTIPAPVTGVSCYFYHTVAWQLKQAGKNKKWEKVAEESLHVPFFLDDNTGRVLVDPQGADMDIHRDFHEEYSGSFFGGDNDAPANVTRFLARHGIANDHKLKIDEYCIKPKNALFVLGTLTSNPGVEVTAIPAPTNVAGTIKFKPLSLDLPPGMADRLEHALDSDPATTFRRTVVVKPVKDGVPQEVIRLSGDAKHNSTAEMTQQGKIAAALTKAGITSPAAWAAAGVATGIAPEPGNGIAVATSAPLTDFETHPPVVLMKGTHNPAFFISWRSQKDIVRSLAWQSTAMIWGGPAVALGCLYYVLAHFGWL